MGSDDIRVHVATATQAADAVHKVRDYRGKYVQLGVAGEVRRRHHTQGEPVNPLVNVLTPKVRAWLYAILFVGSTVFSIYQATDGDWVQFAAGVFAALLGLVAASNASPTPED